MKHTRSNLPVRGFSLVEVMVAVIVICVGLLGIAKMQALSLSNTTIARQRSLAAIEAASLASAMHSNRVYWASNAPPQNTSWSAQVNPAFVSTDAALATQANAGNLTACMGATASGPMCSGAAGGTTLAASDLAVWVADLSAMLPNAAAAITCLPPPGGNAPPSCTIQITWTETAVAMTTQQTAAAAAPTYTLTVEP